MSGGLRANLISLLWSSHLCHQGEITHQFLNLFLWPLISKDIHATRRKASRHVSLLAPPVTCLTNLIVAAVVKLLYKPHARTKSLNTVCKAYKLVYKRCMTGPFFTKVYAFIIQFGLATLSTLTYLFSNIMLAHVHKVICLFPYNFIIIPLFWFIIYIFWHQVRFSSFAFNLISFLTHNKKNTIYH